MVLQKDRLGKDGLVSVLCFLESIYSSIPVFLCFCIVVASLHATHMCDIVLNLYQSPQVKLKVTIHCRDYHALSVPPSIDFHCK